MLRHSTCLALLLLLLVAACGGSGSAPDGSPGPIDQPGPQQAEAQPRGSVLRNTSGAPIGIRLLWAQSNNVIGYHLYISDSPIPDTARGDSSMQVEISSSKLIPQPPGSQPVLVDHIFPVSIGETWYYRLSAVWMDDSAEEESQLSGELQVDITPFTVASIENPNVGVGTTVFLQGSNFGQQDAGDVVEFPGVVWTNGVGFEPVMIPGTIMSWTETRIGVRVPLGATSGNIDVTIGGLTASTPDVFTNSQPYITSLTPLAADTTEEVTLTGNNFGNAQDSLHFVKFALFDVTAADRYVSWSNTQIVFKPLNLRQYELKEVRVSSGGFLSNIGFVELENAPPVPFLRALPDTGVAPLAVKFEPIEDSPGGPLLAFDPEGTNLTYGYDFQDDGNIDLTLPDAGQAPFTYDPSTTLVHTCRLTLTDEDGGTAEDTVTVTTSNPPLSLTDDGSPGGKPLYQTDQQLELNYVLSGGVPNYRVTFVLINQVTDAETIIAIDNGVTPGAQSHTFTIDTTSGTEVPFSNALPYGSWHIRIDADDLATEVDPVSLELPASGPPYDVYRAHVGMINDSTGDPGGTIGTLATDDLELLGYQVAQIDAASMVSGDLTGLHAVIWPAQAVVGQSEPYGWISVAELGLMSTYLDAGGSMVVLGPPSNGGNGAFPQDSTFNTLHQPFISVVAGVVSGDLNCIDFTQNGEYTINSLTINGAVGRNAPGTALTNGGTAHVQNTQANGFFNVFTANATGVGGVYLGMLAYDSLTFPGGITRPMYIDNIVSGSVGF
ncbi:hypothetical protein IT575_04080 [bacterium]|nr:hypothetical protein [bacterium]